MVLNRILFAISAVAFALGCTPPAGTSATTTPAAPAAAPASTTQTASASETTTTSDNSTSSSEGESNFAATYPGGLALAVFAGNGGSTLRLTDDDDVTLEEAQRADEALINGQADSCLPDALMEEARNNTLVTCYEFDQEMLKGTNPSGSEFGTNDGTDGEGQACLVSFAEEQILRLQNELEIALGTGQAALCGAARAGDDVALEEGGEPVSLVERLTETMGEDAIVESATIRRLPDQNGRPVYRTDIVIMLARHGGESEGNSNNNMNNMNNMNNNMGAPMGTNTNISTNTGTGGGMGLLLEDENMTELHVVHSPITEGDNSEYNGVVWFSLPTTGGNSQATMKRYMSIQYAKTVGDDGETYTTAELNTANINIDYDEGVFEDGVVNFNVGADFSGTEGSNNYGQYMDAQASPVSNANDAVSGMTYISFKLKQSDSTGNFAYFQNPGGNYYENARGFIFNMDVDDEGHISGCGTSGAASGNPSPGSGISIRRAMKEPAVLLGAGGFYHPFMHTNNPMNCGSPASAATTIEIEGESVEIMQYTVDCSSNAASSNLVWNRPALNGELANTFVTEQTGTIVSKQCVNFNPMTGLYEIDENIHTEPAGYSLIDVDLIPEGDPENVLGDLPDLSDLIDLEVEDL